MGELSTLSLLFRFDTLSVMTFFRNRFFIFFLACLILFSLHAPFLGGFIDSSFVQIFTNISTVIAAVVIGITAGIVVSHLGSLAYPRLAFSAIGTVFLGVVILSSAFWAADCVLPNSAFDPDVMCHTQSFVRSDSDAQSATIVPRGN